MRPAGCGNAGACHGAADCGGAIFHSENGEGVFCLPPFVPGSMELSLANDEVVRKHPKVAECFEECTRIRTAVLAPMLPMGSGVMRTVPVFKTVDPCSHSVVWEDLSSLLDSCTRFAVAPCSCRRTRWLMGEGCGQCTAKCKFDAIRLKRVSNVKNNNFDGMALAMTSNAVKHVVRITATALRGDK